MQPRRLTRRAKLAGVILLLLLMAIGLGLYWLRTRNSDKPVDTVVWSLETGELSQDSTCYGLNQSPGIRIESLPAGTQSLAVTLEREGKVYWMVWDIPVQDVLQPGIKPDGSVGRNYEGNFRYAGPCPERGVREEFQARLYAVPASSLRISSASSYQDLVDRLKKLDAQYSEKDLSYFQEK